MALTNTTQFANRYGLNIKIYDYELDEQGAVVEPTGTPKMLIDFANVCDVDISGDRVWATGGQAGHIHYLYADSDHPAPGSDVWRRYPHRY